MIFPNNNLPNDAQPWGREIQKQVESLTNTVVSNDVNNTARDKQLAASVARLDKTVTELAITKGIVSGTTTDLTTINNNISAINTQINSSAVSGVSSLAYVGVDGAKTDAAISQLTFTKPSWATKATVICTGTVDSITTDQAGNPISGTMTLAIDGVKLQYSNSISDPTLSGTTINKSISTAVSSQREVATQSFARSFTTSGNVSVQILVTKTANTLTTASYYSNLSATVYWSK